MTERLRSLILATFMLPLAVWGADRQVGIWKMNPEKSKFASDVPGVKSQTVTVEELEGGGLKLTGDLVNAQGTAVHFGYSAKYDGKDNPERGSLTTDTVALKRINASTIQTTAKKDGKVATIITTVISKDGKTRTNTYRGKNAKGEPRTWILVFDKQ